MSMDTLGKVEEGICVVSFDGGGPGTISQLIMIDEFMTRLAFELDKDEDELQPADYFDLMGGVGFGGFAALLLGRLRMTPNEAMKELSTIATATFSEEYNETVLPEANMKRLRKSIENMLQRHNHPADLKLRDDLNRRCKVVVFAATTATVAHCHPFRTYRSRHRTPDCTFVEAACAIMAIPELFSPVAIGPPSTEQIFSGIPYGFNNPMREVFKETHLIFGDEKRVSLVLSIGSGQQSVLSSSEQHTTLLTRIMRDCDTVERELSHQLSSAGAYLRLNVDKGMENIKPSDWHSLGSIVSHTNVYLQMSVITTHVDEASQWLLKRIGSTTLGELTGTGNGALIKFQSQRLSDQLAMEVKQMCNIVQQGMERITLVDAVGNRIPIPMQLCQTYSLLSGIIRSYFEDRQPPGSSLVRRGCYQLISGTKKEIVEPAGWNNIVLPGLTVEMSMILHDRGKHSRSCPRCSRASGVAKNEWATCASCYLQFQVTDKMKRGDVVVSPAVRMSENTGVPTTSEMEETPDEVDERMKFRLISVFNHINAAYAVARKQSRPRHPAKMTRLRAGQKRPFNDTEDQVSSQPGPSVKRVKSGLFPPAMTPKPLPLQAGAPSKYGEIRTPEDAKELLMDAFKKAGEQAMISQSLGQGSQDLDLDAWISQIVAGSADPGPSTLLNDRGAFLPMANEADSQVEGADIHFSDYTPYFDVAMTAPEPDQRPNFSPRSHNDTTTIPPSQTSVPARPGPKATEKNAAGTGAPLATAVEVEDIQIGTMNVPHYMTSFGHAKFSYDGTVEELDEPWALV